MSGGAHTDKCDPESGCDETCTTPLPSESDEYRVTTTDAVLTDEDGQ